MPEPPSRQTRRQPMELENGKSYVIFEHEGAFFPGLVSKVARKNNKVHLKRMNKGNSETSWIFPEKDDILVIDRDDIDRVIETPALTSSRSKEYRIIEMVEYGWPS